MKQCTKTWIISLCYAVYIYTTLYEATGIIGNGKWDRNGEWEQEQYSVKWSLSMITGLIQTAIKHLILIQFAEVAPLECSYDAGVSPQVSSGQEVEITHNHCLLTCPYN